jgi:hypothetical protein
LHAQIENATRCLAKGRLVDPNQGTIHRSRAESHIALTVRDRINQLGRFRNRSREIGVRKQERRPAPPAPLRTLKPLPGLPPLSINRRAFHRPVRLATATVCRKTRH